VKFIVLFMLFCNVAAVGMVLHSLDAGWMTYLNLLGSVVFGGYLTLITNRG